MTRLWPSEFALRNAGLRRKLDLLTEREGAATLAEDELDRMAACRADFTPTLRGLWGAVAGPDDEMRIRAFFAAPAFIGSWGLHGASARLFGVF
ncbi:MAG: hypothetical protein ABSE46_14040 [Terracidiphilus sp.]|jgi:hypothetical protein